MTSQVLTPEQERFLEECSLEFSDRFTDSDLEYKSVYDSGITPPPIMYPWYGRPRFNNRDRPGGSRGEYRNRPPNQAADYQSRKDHYRPYVPGNDDRRDHYNPNIGQRNRDHYFKPY